SSDNDDVDEIVQIDATAADRGKATGPVRVEDDEAIARKLAKVYGTLPIEAKEEVEEEFGIDGPSHSQPSTASRTLAPIKRPSPSLNSKSRPHTTFGMPPTAPSATLADYPDLTSEPLQFDVSNCPWTAKPASPSEHLTSGPPPTPAPYSFLTHTFVTLSSTRSRIILVNTQVNTLRLIITHDPTSLLATWYLLSNSISPAYVPIEMSIGPSIISKAVQSVSGLSGPALRKLFNTTGDPGDAAYEAKSSVRTLITHPTLLIQGEYDSLLKIAYSRGSSAAKSKQSILEKLLVLAKGEESLYLVRPLAQHIRVGAATLYFAMSQDITKQGSINQKRVPWSTYQQVRGGGNNKEDKRSESQVSGIPHTGVNSVPPAVIPTAGVRFKQRPVAHYPFDHLGNGAVESRDRHVVDEVARLRQLLVTKDREAAELVSRLTKAESELRELKTTLCMYDECSAADIAKSLKGINSRIQDLAQNTAKRWLGSPPKPPRSVKLPNKSKIEAFKRIVGPELVDALASSPDGSNKTICDVLLPLAWQASIVVVVFKILYAFCAVLPGSEEGAVLNSFLHKLSGVIKSGEAQPAYGRWRSITHRYLRGYGRKEENAIQEYVHEALTTCHTAARIAMHQRAPDDQVISITFKPQVQEIVEEAVEVCMEMPRLERALRSGCSVNESCTVTASEASDLSPYVEKAPEGSNTHIPPIIR
ncbi:hypothetical protein FRB90_003563, partial [Tulasnella sp. 427]